MLFCSFVFSNNRWSIWKNIKIVVLMNSMFRFFRFIIDLKRFYKLLYALFICLLFNEYDRNLFLWFRFDLTRLIIVFFLLFLRFSRSINTKEKKIQWWQYSFEKTYCTVVKMKKKHFIKQYNFEKIYWSKCSRSDNIVSKKRIMQFRMTKSQTIQFRKNVLCKHD